jgi:chromosome segregation ATPase
MRGLRQSQIDLRAQNSTLTADLAAAAAKLESSTFALQEKASFSGSQGSVIDSLRAELSAKESEIAKMQQTIADLAEQAKDRNWIAEKSKKVIAKHQDDIRKLIQHHNERKAEWERKAEAMQLIERENVTYQEQTRALELALRNSEAKAHGAIEQIEEMRREIDKIGEERKADKQMISYLEGQLNRKGEILVDDTDDDQPLQAQSPKGFKPVSLGGPFSPYVPRFTYPETGSVFDAATFFV